MLFRSLSPWISRLEIHEDSRNANSDTNILISRYDKLAFLPNDTNQWDSSSGQNYFSPSSYNLDLIQPTK